MSLNIPNSFVLSNFTEYDIPQIFRHKTALLFWESMNKDTSLTMEIFLKYALPNELTATNYEIFKNGYIGMYGDESAHNILKSKIIEEISKVYPLLTKHIADLDDYIADHFGFFTGQVNPNFNFDLMNPMDSDDFYFFWFSEKLDMNFFKDNLLDHNLRSEPKTLVEKIGLELHKNFYNIDYYVDMNAYILEIFKQFGKTKV